jgi:hypothetical protein
MRDLTRYMALASDTGSERRNAILECQQSGNVYFNFAEEFVGNSDLLGAHRSALWAQGFAEDCAEILRSLPSHVAFLINSFKQAGIECSEGTLRPGNTAYANMQRMVVKYLTPQETTDLRDQFISALLPVYGFQNEAREFMSRRLQTILSFAFGVAFVIVMLVISFVRPEPTSFQYGVFRTVLALAGAGTVAVFPGFIEVKFGNWLRAGGALAVFVVLYFYNPARLAVPTPDRNSAIPLHQPGAPGSAPGGLPH